MNEKDLEIIEYITQLKISNFIKNNKTIDKSEMIKKIEEMINEKEEMYKMDKKQIERILKIKDEV